MPQEIIILRTSGYRIDFNLCRNSKLVIFNLENKFTLMTFIRDWTSTKGCFTFICQFNFDNFCFQKLHKINKKWSEWTFVRIARDNSFNGSSLSLDPKNITKTATWNLYSTQHLQRCNNSKNCSLLIVGLVGTLLRSVQHPLNI